MTPPRSEGFVRMPDAEFEAILTRAAGEVAKRALADVGLDGDEAALDIRDLRSLVDCIRLVRRTAMQTAVRMITTGVMLALLLSSSVMCNTHSITCPEDQKFLANRAASTKEGSTYVHCIDGTEMNASRLQTLASNRDGTGLQGKPAVTGSAGLTNSDGTGCLIHAS